MRQFRCLLLVLSLVALGTSVQAFSLDSEVKPGPQKYLPLAFDVHFERLPNGDTRFTIKVSENVGSGSRFLKFPEHYSTYLGTAKIIDVSPEEHQKNPSGFTRSESYHSVRKVESERNDNVITCVFTVTEKELADPDFCFFFAELPDSPFPGYSAWFARLKKFVNP